MWARLAVVWLAGCGRIGFGDHASPDAGPPVVVGVVDGSRLHAERWVTADGVAAFARWYDTALGFECNWSGQDKRCLPLLTADAFADPACTKPAVRGPPTDCAPKYAFGAGGIVYTVGEVVTAYSLASGTCMPITDGAIHYALGEEVSPDAFVHATKTTTAVADGLSIVELVGDDGSRQAVDLAYGDGMECDLVQTGSTAFCLPRTGIDLNVFTRSYSDPACTNEVIENEMGSTFADVTYVSEPCFLRGVALGAQVPGTTIYVRDVTGACTPRGIPAAAMFAVTDAAPQFPALTAVDVTAGSRLHARAWRSAGGALLSRGFYDAELGVTCLPRVSGDRAYCMPFGDQAGPSAFASAACTGSLMSLEINCEGPHFSSATTPGVACAGPNTTLSRNDTELVAPPLSIDASGTCVPIDTKSYSITTLTPFVPVDPATLAELALVHD